jgi:hypothetical protein
MSTPTPGTGSLTIPSNPSPRAARRNRRALIAACLFGALSAAGLLLLATVEKVRDSADRTK